MQAADFSPVVLRAIALDLLEKIRNVFLDLRARMSYVLNIFFIHLIVSDQLIRVKCVNETARQLNEHMFIYIYILPKLLSR
jgi:hypothetical protein